MNTVMEHFETTSPCYAKRAVENKNSLREASLCGKLNIRGDVNNVRFSEGVETATGLSLPTEANTLQQNASNRLFWLGPDEWLLHCELDQINEITAAIESQLQGFHSAVTEVSDYYTVLKLDGPDVEALLRKGCPLDLHTNVFKVGDIAQTRFGHASILLFRQADEAWEIQVRWTYAEYLWDYLVSAMATLS